MSVYLYDELFHAVRRIRYTIPGWAQLFLDTSLGRNPQGGHYYASFCVAVFAAAVLVENAILMDKSAWKHGAKWCQMGWGLSGWNQGAKWEQRQ